MQQTFQTCHKREQTDNFLLITFFVQSAHATIYFVIASQILAIIVIIIIINHRQHLWLHSVSSSIRWSETTCLLICRSIQHLSFRNFQTYQVRVHDGVWVHFQTSLPQNTSHNSIDFRIQKKSNTRDVILK